MAASEDVERDQIVLLRLAVDQGVKSLEHQSSTLDSLHGRAGVLLGAAAAVTAFFGSAAVDTDSTDVFLFWLAMALFLGVAGTCIGVVQVRSDWKFTNSARSIADYAGRFSELESLKVIADDLQDRYDIHESQLSKRGRLLTLASIWLVAEVISFAWLLTSTH